MEALVCKRLGDPTDEIESPFALIKGYPIPKLNSSTAVRVKVKATSLNFANYLQITGKYQEKLPLPFIPGSDYAGIVDAVAPGVSIFKVGDPVCSFAAAGSFAQYVVADQSDLFRVPDGCDLVDASAFPVAYGTSHVALVHRAHLTSSQVLLVLGAAGGVGLSAAQIGKLYGATVIAVARGVEKVEFLKSIGIDHVIDSSKESVIPSARKFLAENKLKGVDVLYDPVGGQQSKDSLKLLNWGAQILIIGFASGEIPVIPANIVLVKNWIVHGLYWGSYNLNRKSVMEESMKELLSWLARGLIKVYISHEFNLCEASSAFAALRDRKAIGKVVLLCESEKTERSKL